MSCELFLSVLSFPASLDQQPVIAKGKGLHGRRGDLAQ